LSHRGSTAHIACGTAGGTAGGTAMWHSPVAQPKRSKVEWHSQSGAERSKVPQAAPQARRSKDEWHSHKVTVVIGYN